MADQTTQTQTTATPTASSPEARGASADTAASTAAKTETKRSLNASIEAAFAAAEAAPETNTQATRGREAPTTTEEEVTNDDSEEHTEETSEETETEETSEEDATEDEVTEDTTETEEDETVELDDVDELTAEAMKKVKGADKVPKGFIKRLVKQSAQIRDLKTQLKESTAITIAPTPASPLSDVETLDALDSRVQAARKVKAWCKEHAEGATITRNGAEVELTADDVQARLAHAEAELDAYADRKIALTERASTRPWETAERILPDMFKAGSPENKLAKHLLQTCPEIKTRFNDFEVVLAYALKGHRIATEEASGKAKYVRMELDAKGKPIVPTGTKTTAAQVMPKPKTPASPQATRPALQTGAATKRTRDEVIAAMPPALRKDPEARLRALIENAEAA